MANFTKFFRNGKTFSAYCRMRYGQSKDIWADSALWEKQGIYSIAFDQEAADAKFPPRDMENRPRKYKPAHLPEIDEDQLQEVRMEEMMSYIHSGAGLEAYYEDRDAGYAY